MVERVEEHAARAKRDLVLLPVHAGDAVRLAGEELGGEVPERRDHGGLDELHLAKEVRLAGVDLLRHAGLGCPEAGT